MDISNNQGTPPHSGLTPRHESIIALVMRQTNYGREMAITQLKLNKGDYLKVIRDYIAGSKIATATESARSIPSSKATPNQMIMSEIRHFMDDVNRGYEQRKTHAHRREVILNRLKTYQEQRAQQARTSKDEPEPDNKGGK